MLIFIHIPKTAGTSLRLVAEQHYGTGRILSVYGDAIPRAKEYVARQNLNNIALIRGHIAYGVHEVIDQSCEYITILRHPLDRLASLYLYIRKDRMHFAYENVRHMTFKQFVFSGVTAETDNGQVRQLAGLEEFQQRPYAKYEAIPFGQCRQDALTVARTNVRRHFPVVGVQEHFDEFLDQLHRKYAWQVPGTTPRANTTKSKQLVESLDAATVKDVLTFNHLDLSLWAFALERLGAR
jgi:hypothetical protein